MQTKGDCKLLRSKYYQRKTVGTKTLNMDTTLLSRITTNPSILTGKPVIIGMRISVEQILKMLARGIGQPDIIIEYPMLEIDDIKACLLVQSFNKTFRF